MTTLAFLIARASHLLNHGLYAHARDLGLSSTEGRVLAALTKDDGRHMTELAESLLIKQSTLTKIVDRLERARLVARVASTEDRRLSLALLTERGRQLASPMTQDARRRLRVLVRSLGRARAEQLATALTRLIDVLELWVELEAARHSATSLAPPGRDRPSQTWQPQESAGLPVAADPRETLEFTILFVEDETEIRDSVAAFLASSGFRVLAAPTAGEALHLLGKHRIDALFTDIVMPDINGIELAREARRLRPDLKVLFMTGYSSLAGEAERIGPLLHKPARSTQIESELRKLLATA
jgi:DNA-binding MarR family transcriptional regulator